MKRGRHQLWLSYNDRKRNEFDFFYFVRIIFFFRFRHWGPRGGGPFGTKHVSLDSLHGLCRIDEADVSRNRIQLWNTTHRLIRMQMAENERRDFDFDSNATPASQRKTSLKKTRVGFLQSTCGSFISLLESGDPLKAFLSIILRSSD